MARKNPTFGTVIHGTLKTDDLLQAAAHELAHLRRRRQHDWLVRQAERAIEKKVGDEHLQELFDAIVQELNCLALPYTYFGPLEGDGSDWGWWVSWDALESDAEIAGGSEPPPRGLGGAGCTCPGGAGLGPIEFYVQRNDHGNTTLWRWSRHDRNWRVVWECV